MNKHELKSLLENIHEAMILPGLEDQALSNPKYGQWHWPVATGIVPDPNLAFITLDRQWNERRLLLQLFEYLYRLRWTPQEEHQQHQ